MVHTCSLNFCFEGMRNMDEIFPLLDQVENRRLVMHIFSMNGMFRFEFDSSIVVECRNLFPRDSSSSQEIL